jgi:hypothetical protein
MQVSRRVNGRVPTLRRLYTGWPLVIIGAYRELFAAIATAAAALIGLLFVAISVAPRNSLRPGDAVLQDVRAAASILAFSNGLTVALFGLVPGNNVGYPAVVLGVIGVFFAAAATRSIFDYQPRRWRQLGWIMLMLLVFGFQLAAGISALIDPRSTRHLISDLLVASLLIGVSRAWELVGRRDTDIISSLAVLAGRNRVDPSRLPEDLGPDGDAGRAHDEPLAQAAGDDDPPPLNIEQPETPPRPPSSTDH